MAEQISRLVAIADLQAAKFQSGSQQVAAAEQAMVTGAKQVSVSITDMTGKISASGDGLSRLSRQYDAVSFNQAKFAREVGQLGRALDAGKIKMEGAERILIGMNQRLGLSANAAELAAKGHLTLASAVERANAQIARQNAMQPANSNIRGNNFAGLMAGQQFQDIAVTAAMGQSLPTIMLQQGTQLGSGLQATMGDQGAKGVVTALGSAIVGLFSPINLLAIGITGITAATIQWAMKGKDGVKSLDETLRTHSEALRLIKEQYGEIGAAASRVGPVGGTAYTDATARQALSLDQARLRTDMEPYLKQFMGASGTERFLRYGLFGSGDAGLQDLNGAQAPFKKTVDDFLASVRSGKGDLAEFDRDLNRVFDTMRTQSSEPAKLHAEMERLSDAAANAFAVPEKFKDFQAPINQLMLEGAKGLSTFIAEVERIGQTKGLQTIADEAITSGREVVELTQKVEELQKAISRLDFLSSRPGLADLRELRGYVNQRNAQAEESRLQFEAEQQMARARTNAERLAAVEAQTRARARQDGDRDGGLQARVDRALQAERNRQQVELRDETDARHRAQARSLEASREEMSLIGATVGEAARLRYEFSEIARLKEEAVKRDGIISSEEVRRVKETAAELGKAADAAARINLNRDLAFERDQMGRSEIDQQIASRLRGANLPVDFTSPEAQSIRSNLQQQEWRDSVRGFMGDFQRELMSSGGNVGKAFGSAILNSLMNSTQKAWDKFADAVADLFGKMLGIGGMGGSGGTASLGSSVVGAMIGAANDNNRGGLKTSDFAPMALSGIGSPGAGRAYGNDLVSNIRALAGNIGANPRDLAALMSFESGLKPDIWGGSGGNYYGLIQAGANERKQYGIMPGGSLAAQFGGIEKFFKDRGYKPGMSGLDLYSTVNAGSPGRYNASDAANGGTWGTVADKWNHQMDAHFAKADALLASSTTKTTGALEKLATSSTETAKSLAGGLGQLGGALNQFPGAPGGGGGLLGSLLGGGLNSAFSGSAAFNWLSANPGGAIGLFAEGGVSDRPAIFGDGDGPEAAVPLSRGRYIPVEMRMPRNMGGGGISGLNITWGVDADQQGNLTPYIKKVVQQDAPSIARKESSKAVGNYAYGQRQGGAAADSQRFQRLKRKN